MTLTRMMSERGEKSICECVRIKVEIRTRNALQVALGFPQCIAYRDVARYARNIGVRFALFPTLLGILYVRGEVQFVIEAQIVELCLGTKLHQHVRNSLKCRPVPADLKLNIRLLLQICCYKWASAHMTSR